MLAAYFKTDEVSKALCIDINTKNGKNIQNTYKSPYFIKFSYFIFPKLYKILILYNLMYI